MKEQQMIKDILQEIDNRSTSPIFQSNIRKLCEHLAQADFDKILDDNAQADMKLIIAACRAAGWERDRNAYPSHGDDIGAFITRAESHIGSLREALKSVHYWIRKWAWIKDTPANRNTFPDDTWYPKGDENKKENDPLRTPVSHVGLNELRKIYQQALTSTRPYLEKQLGEVKRVLEFIWEVEWGNDGYCKFCNKYRREDHTETCELASLKTKLEQKRDAIKEELKC